jgi:hypothetical protein
MTLPALRATIFEVKDEDDVTDIERLVTSSVSHSASVAYIVHGELSGKLLADLRRTYRLERCTLDLEGLSTVYSEDYYDRNVKGKKIAFADISSEAVVVDEALDQVRKFLRWDLVVVMKVSSRQSSVVVRRI